jgi:hypothetical protein
MKSMVIKEISKIQMHHITSSTSKPSLGTELTQATALDYNKYKFNFPSYSVEIPANYR